MKISAVQAFLVAFRPEPALGNATTFIRRREQLLVAVRAEDGTVGWGEVVNVAAGAGAVLRSKLAPLALASDPQEFVSLHTRMSGALAYDRRGASMMALSAMDMAVVDLIARIRGESVARMLGGPLRQSITAYASEPFIGERDGPTASSGGFRLILAVVE